MLFNRARYLPRDASIAPHVARARASGRFIAAEPLASERIKHRRLIEISPAGDPEIIMIYDMYIRAYPFINISSVWTRLSLFAQLCNCMQLLIGKSYV